MKAKFNYTDNFTLIAENQSDNVLLRKLAYDGDAEMFSLQLKKTTQIDDYCEVKFQLRKSTKPKEDE